MFFILFQKQNEEVLRVRTTYTFQREKFKKKKNFKFIQKLSCMSNQKTKQIFIEVNMTSKFNRTFSNENTGAAKVSY